MTNVKLRKIMKEVPELSPERLGAALEVVAPVERGLCPATILTAGRLP